MVVIFIGVVIEGNRLDLLQKRRDKLYIKGLGRMILLIASDVVDLIVIIVKKARDGIATTAIDLEIFFK